MAGDVDAGRGCDCHHGGPVVVREGAEPRRRRLEVNVTSVVVLVFEDVKWFQDGLVQGTS